MIPNQQKNGVKNMKRNINLSVGFNFSNRKYKMIGLEMLIFVLIIVVSQILMINWPTNEPLSARVANYELYMLLALLEVILICAMTFVLGIWFTKWRFDINARIPEDMELDPIP